MKMEKSLLLKNNSAGFTLPELLMILSIISILLFVAIGFASNSLENIEMNHFIEVFESDVFYIQNAAFGTRKNVRIVFREDYYVILHDNDITLDIRRDYPTVLIDVNIIQNRISFSNSGTIQTPMTLSFKTNNKTYRIVFPLGKGRLYIAE